MDLKQRISDLLENELAKIYEETGINSGDIDPLQALEWERITAAAAELFSDLIRQNK